MFFRRSTRLYVTVTMLLAIIGLLVFSQGQSIADNISSSPEEQEVISSLKKAYAVLDTPFEQLDLNQLHEVFVNHPIFQERIPQEEFESLKNYTQRVQGEDATKEFGYLTSIKTKRINQKRGAMLLRAAREKANAENREVSAEEMKALKEQNFGMDPWVPSGGGETFVRPLKIHSIKINGDIAEVFYDQGVKNRTAVLVRIEEKWYVAGIF